MTSKARGVAKTTLGHARGMRRAPTPAERVLWGALRGRRLQGLKFRRQYALGAYILDFCCAEHRLVVELDGAGHAEPEQAGYDAHRSQDLTDYGYRVLRFHNEQVLTSLECVLDAISLAAREIALTRDEVALTPNPSPNPGRGE